MNKSPAASTAKPIGLASAGLYTTVCAPPLDGTSTTSPLKLADEDIARSIHRDSQLGAETAGPVDFALRGGGQDMLAAHVVAAGRNLHYFIQVVVRDKEIARSIHRQTLRVIEPDARWSSAVPFGRDLHNLLCVVRCSAMKTSPAASTATPFGTFRVLPWC